MRSILEGRRYNSVLYRTCHDAITHVSHFVPEAPNEEIFLRLPIDHVLGNFAAEQFAVLVQSSEQRNEQLLSGSIYGA